MSRFLVIPHSDSPIRVSAAADSSERGAQRDNPTVIALMELCYGDLHSDTEVEMKSLDQWIWTDNDAGNYKHLFVSPQGTIHPECRVLLDHGPKLSLDPIVDRSIKDESSAQNIRAARRKVCAKRALNVPGAQALGGGESRRQHRVTKAIRCATGRNGTTQEEPDKIVALALRSGNRGISPDTKSRRIRSACCLDELRRAVEIFPLRAASKGSPRDRAHCP